MLKLNYSTFSLEAGTDEAGRGCLCGPVVAAAVILPKGFSHELLNDSKKLSEKQRKLLRPFIEENAICFSVSFVDQVEIDNFNILQASITAMHRAIDKLKTTPEFIIIDGNKFKPYKNIPFKTIVKGDAKYMSIAAASILAKTYRDDFMAKIDEKFPEYNWKKNKGYPTKEHRNAIRKFGATPFHRKSFKLLPKQLKLNL
ncbi:MAG TPA: ribonuclease HII [Tenacibaculum sp.]|nr:ribonuclease HII [Tenacibaculum sp.]